MATILFRDANGAPIPAFAVGATVKQAFLATTAAELTVVPGLHRFHTTAACTIAEDGQEADADADDMPFDVAQSGEMWEVKSTTIKIYGGSGGGSFSATLLAPAP